jgi:thioredoxin reductase (NADPH)
MREFDLVVIGAGVAGLTAATAAARQGVSVAVVERMGAGGQIANAERIENYPGYPQGIAGHELGPLLHEQAEAAGAEFLLDTVEGLALDGERRIVRGAGEALAARAVIVAAGSTLRSLGVPGEETFLGRGVSHCASCDGPFFAGKTVCVVGGGDSAIDEALTLAQHAARVLVFHRGKALRAQKVLADRAAAEDRIDIAFGAIVEEILGTDAVTGVRLRDAASGATRITEAAGVFVYVGLAPNTAFVRGTLALDETGRIVSGEDLQTSVPGIFAAGDIRAGSPALLTACVDEGTAAAAGAVRFAKSGR